MKPWDKVKMPNEDTRLFIFNPYGYITNINHTEVLPLYERFREKHSIPTYSALSDDERLKFEKELIESEQFKKRFNAWYSQYKYLMPIKTKETIEKMIGDDKCKKAMKKSS